MAIVMGRLSMHPDGQGRAEGFHLLHVERRVL